MDQETIARYQPGGDIYNELQAQYGTTAANSIAQAAATGDEGQVNSALATVRDGPALDDSTADAFVNLITTDPLGAPLADAEGLASNTFFDLLESPLVIVAGVLILFFAFGGADTIRNWIKKL